MARYSIVTDLNRCVGCLACSVACKAVNGVPVGSFWNKTLRIGPNPKEAAPGSGPTSTCTSSRSRASTAPSPRA